MTSARARLLRSFVAVTVAALLLAGCGDDGSDSSPGRSHNDADVAFATGMIPHHEQALQMVDMVEGRSVSPEFEHLTEGIAEAQAPEIDDMTAWLEDWGDPVPSGHTHMMDGGSMGPGMMGDDDLDELGDMTGSGFEDRWLRAMIAHHEGAIAMARTEIEDGEYDAAVELARSIVTSQQAEIDQMQRMSSR